MKKLLFFYCLIISTILSAQAPQGINYQAVYRDANGLVKNKTIAVECFILDNSSLGAIIYSETHSPKTNNEGLFTLIVGKGTSPKAFSSIDWSNGQKWCEIRVDGTKLGSFQFQSVPYALYAENIKPSIAIFEESTLPGVEPIQVTCIDNCYNKRKLSSTVQGADFVSLNNSNLTFKQVGTYFISASAPFYKGGNHRLFLRIAGGGSIKLAGTSEFATKWSDTGAASVMTRSFINGILVVTAADLNLEYSLDHWIEDNKNDKFLMGYPCDIKGVPETYAQIVIQKIK